MLSDEEALFAAILANPDDDLPRLVYADWLEEHGDADRAKFIRVQCEIATMPEAGKLSDRKLIEKRERLVNTQDSLLAGHREEWENLPKAFLQGRELYRPLVTFRRGFVDDIHIGHDYFRMGDIALAETLSTWKQPLATNLMFNRNLFQDAPGIAAALSRWELPNLKNLSLKENSLGRLGYNDPIATAAALSHWHLPKLKTLSLSNKFNSEMHSRTFARAAEALTKWKLPELTELDLRLDHPLENETLRAFLRWPLEKLESINLSNNYLDPLAVASIIEVLDEEIPDGYGGRRVALPNLKKIVTGWDHLDLQIYYTINSSERQERTRQEREQNEAMHARQEAARQEATPPEVKDPAANAFSHIPLSPDEEAERLLATLDDEPETPNPLVTCPHACPPKRHKVSYRHGDPFDSQTGATVER